MILTNEDLKLIEEAKKIIDKNYDNINWNNTVGCALMTVDKKIYLGVNLDAASHGSCAEYIAMGNAITNGERNFETIIAILKIDEGYKILPPCGNCRQMLYTYAKDINIIISDQEKVSIKELLKYPCD